MFIVWYSHINSYVLTIRYDTKEGINVWTKKLSDQPNLAHVARKKLKQTCYCGKAGRHKMLGS